MFNLTHLSPSSLLWDIGKQNSPRCDAAERGVPSGAILFAYVTSTLDHVLTTSLPRSKNSRTWRGRGQNETISDF